MRSQLPIGIATVLLTILAAGTHLATAWEPSRLDLGVIAAQQELRSGFSAAMGWEPGRLATFAARQDLRDEVCIAMADGRLSRAERYVILSNAKRVLKPREYEGFKQSLDRAAPPKPAMKQTAKIAQKKSLPKVWNDAPLPPDSSLAPTMPTDVIQPDRVVSAAGAR